MRTGLAYGAGAYATWGMYPAFFGLLMFASPIEVVAHRISWTLVFMVVVLTTSRQWRLLSQFGCRTWLLVAVAATAISVNWGTYLYAVSVGQVSQAALGYFINPLVNVAIGIAVFREKTTLAGRSALALAVVAVIVLTVADQRVPVIALVLAGTFALYGVVKKLTPMMPATSLAAETLLLVPFAVGYLVWLTTSVHGGASHTPVQLLLLALCGPVTAVPLLMFGAAAHRLPVSTIGMLQYLTPTMQFLWAVLVVREPLSATSWVGFSLVWLALLVFIADTLRRGSRGRAATAA